MNSCRLIIRKLPAKLLNFLDGHAEAYQTICSTHVSYDVYAVFSFQEQTHVLTIYHFIKFTSNMTFSHEASFSQSASIPKFIFIRQYHTVF